VTEGRRREVVVAVDPCVARIWVRLQQRKGGDDLAGLAVAAGSDAAVVFGSGQVKLVPQGLKTWGVWVYIYLLCRAV
jgi:hypothetical protein